MNKLTKLIRADESRRTRFHTSNGHLCLQPTEFLRALGTTIVRIGFKRYSHSPWLAYSATSHIAALASGKRVFEFGSGMSTLWFADRCREVVSTESDSEWHAAVTKLAGKNVRVIYAESRTKYLCALMEAGGKFDIILIDGLYRKQCVEMVRPYLNPGGAIIVDNTDVDCVLSETVNNLFGDSTIRAFRGWAPGILHPTETTVVQNVPL